MPSQELHHSSSLEFIIQSEFFIRCPKGTWKWKAEKEVGHQKNDARQLYLATYGRIDTINNLIKNCQMYYCCWKYWHSAKNHRLLLAVVVTCGMYK
jgi:hypothetical protein